MPPCRRGVAQACFGTHEWVPICDVDVVALFLRGGSPRRILPSGVQARGLCLDSACCIIASPVRVLPRRGPGQPGAANMSTIVEAFDRGASLLSHIRHGANGAIPGLLSLYHLFGDPALVIQ